MFFLTKIMIVFKLVLSAFFLGSCANLLRLGFVWRKKLWSDSHQKNGGTAKQILNRSETNMGCSFNMKNYQVDERSMRRFTVTHNL